MRTASPSGRAREKQLDLSRLLVDELRAIGLADAELNEAHSVFATLPGHRGRPGRRVSSRTSTRRPTSPGPASRPIVHEAWAGEPIVLPGDPHQILDPEALPALAARVGHDS